MMNTPKSICIVEDKDDLREALSMMIKLTDGYQMAGAFKNAEEALHHIPEVHPAAVLMDINLPDASGIQCVVTLKSKLPDILFLMCTAYEDNDKIFSSLKAGASGYILKTDGPAKIVEALDELFAGGSPMSSSIARKVVASFSGLPAGNHLVQRLSDREEAVLHCLAKGLMNKEVADSLQISQGTVKKHIQHIYEKLHVNTRVEAVNLYLGRTQ
ncbi:response regulator [Phnomibacter sp. MR]|uniref:response regulator n=1 Tax=Phnomibacter sp. MR TaxID=3042318 RepID=UPI003A7F872F|nr:response regulator transcription factor [Chitinophagaceae bacterium]